VFPTTIWTTIRRAGDQDTAALQDVAVRYRTPVLEYIRKRGFQGSDAEDLCQDVFVRVLEGGVLAKADRQRGRFRSLLLSVTTHVIQDRLRKRRELPVEDPEISQGVERPQPEFDEGWALHLAERAMQRLKEEGSPYYKVLEGHLSGEPQDRNKLWIARRKLAAHIRREVAYTCATRDDFQEEIAYLARYLRPREASGPGPADVAGGPQGPPD
jgi:RNA polymerase sigma factor (sigma-70 family)